MKTINKCLRNIGVSIGMTLAASMMSVGGGNANAADSLYILATTTTTA